MMRYKDSARDQMGVIRTLNFPRRNFARQAIFAFCLGGPVGLGALELFADNTAPFGESRPQAVNTIALPGEITLAHKGAIHRLIVKGRTGDNLAADLTARAKFGSSNLSAAIVEFRAGTISLDQRIGGHYGS